MAVIHSFWAAELANVIEEAVVLRLSRPAPRRLVGDVRLQLAQLLPDLLQALLVSHLHLAHDLVEHGFHVECCVQGLLLGRLRVPHGLGRLEVLHWVDGDMAPLVRHVRR
jgi:hypothetical protein